MSEETQHHALEHVIPPWTTLVAVCKQCDGYSKSLFCELKSELRSRYATTSRGVRLVKTSCLNVCPKDGVTATVQGLNAAHTVILRTKNDVQTFTRSFPGQVSET